MRTFLRSQEREEDWHELTADRDADYEFHDRIDLSKLEPLIAMPSSPANVVPVREVAGQEIYQAYVGSSANPGYRDFAIAAEIVRGRRIHDAVSFDVNPTSRQILENLIRDGYMITLVHAGARIHQAGCNGCIGMGQAPATHKISLRTVPRNFPGRSGTREDRVCLVSPETAAASALMGVITDPRTLPMNYPRVREPQHLLLNVEMLSPPLRLEDAQRVKLVKGPNIAALPAIDPLPDNMDLPVLLKVGDNISTDEIMPAGARVLPYRSNIPKISEFVFEGVDETYWQRARQARGGHAIVAGHNYGQGSSREHAALAPRYLGLRVVLARTFARIHRQNLIAYGVLPLTFEDDSAYRRLERDQILRLRGLHRQMREGHTIVVENITSGERLNLHHDLSARQIAVVIAGGLANWVRSDKEERIRQPIRRNDNRGATPSASSSNAGAPKRCTATMTRTQASR